MNINSPQRCLESLSAVFVRPANDTKLFSFKVWYATRATKSFGHSNFPLFFKIETQLLFVCPNGLCTKTTDK